METQTCELAKIMLISEKNEHPVRIHNVAHGLDFGFIDADHDGALSERVRTVRLFGDPSIDAGFDPKSGGFRIEEISTSGSVPTLRASNQTPFDVLLIAGQLVRGGKQNRGINADLLVASGQVAVIPVTCVERGRWSGDSRSGFEHGGFEPAHLRRGKMAEVHMHRKVGRAPVANQSRVWSEVDAITESLNARSQSADLLVAMRADRYAQRASRRSTASQTEIEAEIASTRGACTRVNELLRALIESGGEAEHYRSLTRQLADLTARLAELEQARAGLSLGLDSEKLREKLERAREAAAGASGMLVFIGGEFVTGDLFANPDWFARMYGDLSLSATTSYEALVSRDRNLRRSDGVTQGRADSIVRDALHGNWIEQPPIAHGRSRLLEHPYLESAATLDADGTPLHVVIGTRHSQHPQAPGEFDRRRSPRR
ncbi:MAG: ARPP-1 family domain-containing protein [Planctomycetota bacterium]